jgi:hypothetical protein
MELEKIGQVPHGIVFFKKLPADEDGSDTEPVSSPPNPAQENHGGKKRKESGSNSSLKKELEGKTKRRKISNDQLLGFLKERLEDNDSAKKLKKELIWSPRRETGS